MELFNRLLVEAQILLAANEDDGQALAEVKHFGDPLRPVSGGSIETTGACRTFS